jgi:hypothetical protein
MPPGKHAAVEQLDLHAAPEQLDHAIVVTVLDRGAGQDSTARLPVGASTEVRPRRRRGDRAAQEQAGRPGAGRAADRDQRGRFGLGRRRDVTGPRGVYDDRLLRREPPSVLPLGGTVTLPVTVRPPGVRPGLRPGPASRRETGAGVSERAVPGRTPQGTRRSASMNFESIMGVTCRYGVVVASTGEVLDEQHRWCPP